MMKSVIQGKEYFHEAIVDKCIGCARVAKNEKVCVAYLSPKAKWRPSPVAPGGHCPMATHVELETGNKDAGKKRVGQQKQKKKK